MPYLQQIYPLTTLVNTLHNKISLLRLIVYQMEIATNRIQAEFPLHPHHPAPRIQRHHLRFIARLIKQLLICWQPQWRKHLQPQIMYQALLKIMACIRISLPLLLTTRWLKFSIVWSTQKPRNNHQTLRSQFFGVLQGHSFSPVVYSCWGHPFYIWMVSTIWPTQPSTSDWWFGVTNPQQSPMLGYSSEVEGTCGGLRHITARP